MKTEGGSKQGALAKGLFWQLTQRAPSGGELQKEVLGPFPRHFRPPPYVVPPPPSRRSLSEPTIDPPAKGAHVMCAASSLTSQWLKWRRRR